MRWRRRSRAADWDRKVKYLFATRRSFDELAAVARSIRAYVDTDRRA